MNKYLEKIASLVRSPANVVSRASSLGAAAFNRASRQGVPANNDTLRKLDKYLGSKLSVSTKQSLNNPIIGDATGRQILGKMTPEAFKKYGPGLKY